MATKEKSLDELWDAPGLSPSLLAFKKILVDSNIRPEDVGGIEKVKISQWEGFSKGEDGEPVITPLSGTSLILNPKWEKGPAWPVVQPAKPTLIKPVKAVKKPKSAYREAVILPDPQFGYRSIDGTFDPFHDEKAIACALKIVADVQPELIVLLGDLLDFAQFSAKFVQEPSFALTTQRTLDRCHEFLAQLRATCPKAEIKILEGNHEQRLPMSIIKNAAAAYGIRQANIPETWPVLSIPHLLRLDELKAEYISGYPNGRVWINDRLACAHAPSKLRSGGSSAAASIDDERVSVITGHIHKIEIKHKTRNVRGGFKQNFVASLGCLCRIDGAVPSTKGALDVRGRPVLHYEDWQHAVGVVTFKPGDGPFALDIVPIIEGEAIFRGRPV